MSSSDLIADRRFLDEERAWHGIVCPRTRSADRRATFRRTSLSAYSSTRAVNAVQSTQCDSVNIPTTASPRLSPSSSRTPSFPTDDDAVCFLISRRLLGSRLANKLSTNRQRATGGLTSRVSTRQQSRQVVSGPFKATQRVPARCTER